MADRRIIGQVVWFRLKDGSGTSPGIIVATKESLGQRAKGKLRLSDEENVHLVVYTPEKTIRVYDVPYDRGAQPGTWKFPVHA